MVRGRRGLVLDFRFSYLCGAGGGREEGREKGGRQA